MTLPATVNSGLSWSAWRNAVHGPIAVGSNLYAVLVDATSNHAEVWKSTDGGNTWSEQDSANHQAIDATTAAYKSVGAVLAGSTIHVTYLSSGRVVATRPFATSTDTWGTASASTGAATVSSVTAQHQTAIAVRSDGDRIIGYMGAVVTVSMADYRRARYSRLEVSTWTTAVLINATADAFHYDFQGAVLGSSDRTHFFYTRRNPGNTTCELMHRTLTSANALQTEQQVDASISTNAYDVGVPWSDGTTVYVPYVDSDGTLRVASATSADNPTWSTAAVSDSGNNPESVNANPGAVTSDGTDWHLMWPNDAQTSILRDKTASGSWGTDATFASSLTAVQGVNIADVGSPMGVLYSDNGTVRYNEHSLGTPATLTVTTATATAQAEAITLDAASVLTATTATASAAAQAVTFPTTFPAGTATVSAAAEGVTFDAAANLTMTAATATAQAEAVNLSAAQQATFPAGTATATAQAESVSVSGQARLAVTAATATSQAEGITLDAGSVFTAGTATATAAAQASTLAGQARLALTVATATAQAEATVLTGQARLVASPAIATAQAEGITFDAAARMVLAAALATAEAGAVNLTGGASVAGTLTVSPATAAAAAEGVTFDAASVLAAGTATATATAEGVTFDAAARMVLATAVATSQAEAVTFDAASALIIGAAAATADAGTVALRSASLLAVSPALATATAGAVDLSGTIFEPVLLVHAPVSEMIRAPIATTTLVPSTMATLLAPDATATLLPPVPTGTLRGG